MVGMVLSQRQRDLILPGLDSGDSGCFSDTISRVLLKCVKSSMTAFFSYTTLLMATIYRSCALSYATKKIGENYLYPRNNYYTNQLELVLSQV
jgi:hypothetical protein